VGLVLEAVSKTDIIILNIKLQFAQPFQFYIRYHQWQRISQSHKPKISENSVYGSLCDVRTTQTYTNTSVSGEVFALFEGVKKFILTPRFGYVN
jgi:hypothetical protein